MSMSFLAKLLETTVPSSDKHPNSLSGVTVSESKDRKRKLNDSTSPKESQTKKKNRPSPETRNKIRAERRSAADLRRKEKLNKNRLTQASQEEEQSSESESESDQEPTDSEESQEHQNQSQEALLPKPTSPKMGIEDGNNPSQQAPSPGWVPQTDFWNAMFNHPQWQIMRAEDKVVKSKVESLESEIKDIKATNEERDKKLMQTIDEKHEETKSMVNKEVQRLEVDLKKAMEIIDKLVKDQEKYEEEIKKQVEAAVAKNGGPAAGKREDNSHIQSIQLDKCRYNIIVPGITERADTPEGKELEKNDLMDKLKLLDPKISYEEDIRFHSRFKVTPGCKRPLAIRVTFRQAKKVEEYLDIAYNKDMKSSFWRDWPKFLRDKSNKIKAEVKRLNASDPSKQLRLVGHRGLVWSYEETSKRKHTGSDTDQSSSTTGTPASKKKKTETNSQPTQSTAAASTSTKPKPMTKAEKNKQRRLRRKEKADAEKAEKARAAASKEAPKDPGQTAPAAVLSTSQSTTAATTAPQILTTAETDHANNVSMLPVEEISTGAAAPH